ncbi:MAG: cell wall-binding repeat-containing protein [Candidatus Thermoplasmatota archaeon]
MNKSVFISNKGLIAVGIALIMTLGVFIPVTQAGRAATESNNVSGFEKGPSYTKVAPLKKATLVNYDGESYIDDYAYMASVPTTVFKQGNSLVSNPLLFYKDEYPVEEDADRSLNARQGLDYFMEDWMSYCNGQMDQKTLINVAEEKTSQWKSKNTVTIDGDDPYKMASEIALQDWSYNNEAVVSVIKPEYLRPAKKSSFVTEGTLKSSEIEHRDFKIEKPNIGLGATWKSFEINNHDHKYIISRVSWEEKVDYDLQLYDGQLGMVQAAAGAYSDPYPYYEIAASYIHNYGDWEISVSAIQKKGADEDVGKMEEMYYQDSTKETGIFSGKNKIDARIALLPGTNVKLEEAPFGCRDVEITLDWEGDTDLGFTLLGPQGTEIGSSVSIEGAAAKCLGISDEENTGGEKSEVTLNFDRLGECREDESYSLCVFSLEDVDRPIDFTVEYSWSQNFSRDEVNGLSSASNGAVLASQTNSPLLYTSTKKLPESTKNALYKLGVEKIHLVDLGGELSDEVKDELNSIAEVKSEFSDPKEIYDSIEKISGQKDVIFTTIDPWSYWYVFERKEADEHPQGFHVGPATYIAAHHGSPVVYIENHPRLSQASVWSTDWWKKHAVKRTVEPSSGSMVYTSRIVYDFLEDYGFGDVDEDMPWADQEKIITVAGQFDIGTPWDRCFTGAALPGRFWGHPVDSAYAICRNMFYPALVFENPALKEDNKYINGSKSEVQRGILKGLLARFKEPKGINLVTTRPSQEETFTNPTLHSYCTYAYRYNMEAAEHFNCKYTRADGIIPGVTASDDRIDEGVVPGKSAAYYPDMSESEVVPFYARKAGYDNVFSTNFEKVTENLNRGVLIWFVNSHGMFDKGGRISFWDPGNPYTPEENPWRVYDRILLNPGNIREFIRWVPYLLHEVDMSGWKPPESFLDGFIKWHLLSEVGSTANPDVGHINYQLIYINKLRNKLGIPFDPWGATGFMIYRDRLKQPLKTMEQGLPFVNFRDGDGKVTISPMSGHNTMKWYNSIAFDDKVGNLHSCGIDSISCLPANTYLHLTWMRHGTTYQVIDPWTTTDWAGIWQQQMIKRFALGDTVGEAYEKGMRAVGPEYSADQWWWDVWENVVYFGDPDLRVYVPSTEYSDANNWEKKDTRPLRYDSEMNFDGHMPFGADSYPHEREPQPIEPLWIVISIVALIAVIAAAVVVIKRKK